MEGISWLLFSWGLVAALCYFALNKLGLTEGQGEERRHVGGGSTASPTGSNSANADWTNEVISWLYNNFHKVPGPLEAWIKSLNDAAKKVTSPTKCEILFEGFGDHSNAANAPKFSQVRVEQGPRDHLTLRSHVHLPSCKLRLVSSQRTPERMLVSNYEANIVDLRGEVEGRLACIAGQLYVMACFNGRPEMEVELRNTDTHSTSEVNREMVEEAIRRCLLSAVTNINLSEQTGGHVGDSWNRDMSPAHAVGELFRTMNQHANASPYHAGGSRSHSPNRSNASPTVYQQASVHNYSFDRPDSASGHHRETSGLSAHSPAGVQRESSFKEGAGLSGSNEPVLRDASPTHHATDMFKRLNQSNLMTPAMNNSTVPNKLRVTVIKANRLGKGVEVQQPYIVIEMDEPAARHHTSKGINMSPYWEETFDFELTPASEEILFEAYEGASGAVAANEKHFLGLAIVNFEEIRRSGETVHQLRLQGRPYRNDVVQGDLTVQFDFYFDPSVQSAGKVTDKVVVRAPNGAEFCETVTTTRRPIYDPHDNMDVPEVIPTKTTTVTVKTVSHSLKEKPMISSVHGSMENAVDPHTQHILDQTFNRHYITEALNKDRSLEQRDFEPVTELQPNIHSGNEPLRMHNNQEKIELTVHNPVEAAAGNERQSRDRSKRGGAPGEKRESSFFGQLRDRLSGRRKSQKRSKSVDMHGPEIEEAVSLPPSRDQSRTRYSEGPRSLYETTSVGGKSGHSTRSLYQHSTLVLELAQKDGNKYFLIPPSMLTEPAAAKLMRRGKKLHVYNEHTFVAVKIRGGASCNVCNGRINRSFSKQAYQCRDCKMICHKSCHYKTDAFCTQSTVSKLQIAKDVDWAHFLSHTQLEEFISFEGI